MSIDVDYVKSHSLFSDEWRNEMERLSQKYRLDSKKKLPDRPGPGWLQGVAAHNNLCIRLTKKNDGDYRICGRPASSDPYLCNNCVQVLENMKEVKAEVEEPF